MAGALATSSAAEVRPVLWTRDAGDALAYLPLPEDAGRVYGRVTAASFEGHVLVGELNTSGAVWLLDAGLTEVPLRLWGVSSDGTVVAASGGNGALFESRVDGGPGRLLVPCPDGGTNAFITALDPNGVFAVGTCTYPGVPDQRAVMFDSKLPGSFPLFADRAQATAVAADGQAAAGFFNVDGGLQAFRWSRVAGFEVLAGPTSDECYARAISRDGRRVAGWCRLPSGGGVALLWEDGGARTLLELARDEGVALDPSASFGDVQLMSHDGRTFVGSGFNPAAPARTQYWLRLSR